MGGHDERPRDASAEPPTFEHSSGNDLDTLLDMYVRPDRRVLDRRAGVDPAFDPTQDRRVADRRTEPEPEPIA